MTRFLLFLLLPFSLFGVTCAIEEDTGDSEVIIRCHGQGQDGPSSNVLDQAQCEYLKSQVNSVLSDAENALRSSASTIGDMTNDVVTMKQDVESIQYENSQIDPFGEHSLNIAQVSGQLSDDLESFFNNLVFVVSDLEYNASQVAAMKSQVSSYSCSNESCSGSGDTVSCPCQSEFNQVLQRMAESKSVLDDIKLLVASNNVLVASYAMQLDIMADCLTSITNRLNRPDDRMWGELESIYLSMQSNLHSVAYSSLNFQQIFYSLRSLIRGDTENRLNLTTEGVISLVDSVLSMARNSQDQYNISQFDNAVRYFSNTVSRYFQEFNLTALNLSYTTPWATKSQFLYDAFTNTSLNAANRFYKLFRSSSAQVTNWFQRMELYQQAQLGWFDDNSPLSFEANQDRTTESELEYSFEQTTNTLGSISSGASNVFNNVSSIFSPIVGDLASVEIVASLPTQIVFLPDIETSMGTLPSLYLDCSEISDYCDVARKATTLIWKFAIWAMYIAVSVGLARLLFILVLYVIHFVQNL